MYRYLPLIFFLGFVLLQCDNIKKSNTMHHPHKLDTVPYSESVQVGNILYISGQIANTNDDYNKIVDGGKIFFLLTGQQGNTNHNRSGYGNQSAELLKYNLSTPNDFTTASFDREHDFSDF